MKHLYFFKRIGLCLGMLFLSLSLSAQSLSYEALSGASSSPSDLSISEVYSNYLAYIDPENKIGTLTSMTTIHSSVNSSNFSGTSMNSSSVMAQYRDTQGRIASAEKAARLMNQIEPESSCYAKVKSLSRTIKAGVKDVNNKEWALLNKQLESITEIEKNRLANSREIALAYAKNQPKTVTYNVRGWW